MHAPSSEQPVSAPAVRIPPGRDPLVDAIDAILPQTQCTKCNYTGCRPYAAAIAAGEADINQCPPGGDVGIHKLADLLHRDYQPLNPANGVEAPRTVAWIDENICIGCTLCILACPVDAIVGAAKLMHTVVPELCTGCDLCVATCPVDCIYMHAIPPGEAIRDRTDQWRQQHEWTLFRRGHEKQESERKPAGADAPTSPTEAGIAEPVGGLMADQAKKALLAAAMERARLQREKSKA